MSKRLIQNSSILNKRSLIVFGSWLKICYESFEDLLIYDKKSFDFLNDLYVPSFKLNAMSEKCLISRLVSMSMANPISLNIFYNIFAHSIYLLTIKNSQYEQSWRAYFCTIKTSHCYIEGAFRLFFFTYVIVA